MASNSRLDQTVALQALADWKADCARLGQYRAFVHVSKNKYVGRRHLHMCPRQNRPITLLSDGEFRAYELLIWCSNATEIYEQYPLDVTETIEIADALGYVHPHNWKIKGRPAHVMSTDFVVRHIVPETKDVVTTAYTFKYFDTIYPDQLDRYVRRTWQKLKIESEFWRRRNVAYRVLTERDATKELAYNLTLCRFEYDPTLLSENISDFSKTFVSIWYSNKFEPIREIIELASQRLGISSKRGTTVFKNSVLQRAIPIDLSEKIEFHRSVELAI